MNYQILNFWEYQTVFANVSALAPGHVYTPHRPTLGFKEIVSQVTCWALPWNNTSLVRVIPEISNDAQNWESLSALAVGPLTSPGTTILKQDEVAAYQRFEIEVSTAVPIPFTSDSGISLLIQSIGRCGKIGASGRGASVEEYARYLDAFKRGENWGEAQGGGRMLEFFPRQLVVTSGDWTGQRQSILTRPFPTHELSEVAASLSVDSFIEFDGGNASELTVNPQISIDGIHWQELGGSGFAMINPGTLFPYQEFKLIQTIGAFMRFSINFFNPVVMMASMGANLEIIGCGRDG